MASEAEFPLYRFTIETDADYGIFAEPPYLRWTVGGSLAERVSAAGRWNSTRPGDLLLACVAQHLAEATAERYRLAAALAETTTAAEAQEDEARRYFAKLAQVMTVLGLCAIPLEALHATELDGKALCDEVKDGIREAVAALRTFMAAPK